MNASTVLIVGGTGTLARPVVREFVRQGFRVRLLARHPAQAQKLFGPAVELTPGSLTDASSLATAAAGVDLVYVNLPATHNPKAAFIAERDGMRNLLRVLPQHVPILKLSEIGAGSRPDFIDLNFKYQAEQLLQESGHPYVIFRPTWFMESLPYLLTMFGVVTYFGRQPHPHYWIAGADYAHQVVTAAQNFAAVQNRVLTTQGPEPLLFREAAQRYIQAYNPRLVLLPLPLWVAGLLTRFSHEWRFNQQVMDYYDKRQEIFKSQTTWDLLGSATITIDQFARNLRTGPKA